MSLLSSSLCVTFLVSPGYAMDPPKETYNNAVLLLRKNIAGELHSKEEILQGLQTLKNIAEIKDHPDQLMAETQLLRQLYSLFGFCEEREKIALSFCKTMVKNILEPQSSGTPGELFFINPSKLHNAVIRLFLFKGTEEDKSSLTSYMSDILKNKSHPAFFTSAAALVRARQSNQNLGLNVLREIAENSADPNWVEASTLLSQFGTEDDQKIIGTNLLKNIKNPESYRIAEALFAHVNEGVQRMGIMALRKIANDPSHTYSFQAAVKLFYSENADDKAQGTQILAEVIKNYSHPHYSVAVQAFANSDFNTLTEETLLNLLPAFSMENKNIYLDGLLPRMLRHPNLKVQKGAGKYFLSNPLKYLKHNLNFDGHIDFLRQHPKGVRKIHKALLSSPGEDSSTFNAACLILRLSNQEQFIGLAKKVFVGLMETQSESFLFCIEPLLQSIQDVDFREQLISHLFTLAKSKSPEGDNRALELLLNQNNGEIRADAINLCRTLVDTLKLPPMDDVERSQNQIVRFLNIGVLLNRLPEGKPLAQQVLDTCQPVFQKMFVQSDKWSARHTSFLRPFMQLGTEDQQRTIYNFIKATLSTTNDERTSDEAEEAVNILISDLGVDHPWSQDLIELGAKRRNATHPNSPFAVHKELLEKIKVPAKHFLPLFQLGDGRTVTFNLKTLKTKRQICDIPVKHSELVNFVNQLLLEAKDNLSEFELYAHKDLLQSAMETVNTAFFKSLLDADDQKNDTKQISLISYKLRQILSEVKKLKAQEAEEAPIKGITPSSRLILSLLNNVFTCPAGKENGIEQAHRLLNNYRGASEDDLQQEQVKESIRECLMEQMRLLRETLIMGGGPVIRSLFEKKIEEDAHQAKYLANLLGEEIGIFLEGKSISFDQNGGCVSAELRKCSLQKALNTFYKLYTPELDIDHAHEFFNSKGIMGKIDGRNTLAKVMGEFLTYKQAGDPDLVKFDDFETPIGITRLGTAEILIQTGILDVIEKDKQPVVKTEDNKQPVMKNKKRKRIQSSPQ